MWKGRNKPWELCVFHVIFRYYFSFLSTLREFCTLRRIKLRRDAAMFFGESSKVLKRTMTFIIFVEIAIARTARKMHFTAILNSTKILRWIIGTVYALYAIMVKLMVSGRAIIDKNMWEPILESFIRRLFTSFIVLWTDELKFVVQEDVVPTFPWLLIVHSLNRTNFPSRLVRN